MVEEAEENRTANNVESQKTLQEQILEVVSMVFEVILLLLQVFYEIGIAAIGIFYSVPPKSIKEDIVLVTGAGHGIGRELALLYAAEGCTVVCWDIHKENNEMTGKEILKNGGPKPFCYICDVSNRDEVLKVAKQVKEDVGDVTILINNAGIMPTHPLEKHTPDEIRRIMDINVLSNFWTIEAFLPAMKSHNHGHIVCLSSIAGVVGIANLVPYSASKYAVRGLMETLAEELRFNKNNRIKTTTICPYMVNTGLCKKPIVKYEGLMALLEPKYVAEKIIQAQRADIVETTIPSYLLTLNLITRLLPQAAIVKVKDFFGGGVESDL